MGSTTPRRSGHPVAALLSFLLLALGALGVPLAAAIPAGAVTAAPRVEPPVEPPTLEVAGVGSWLAGQLSTSDGLLTTSYGGQSYPDYGLTADAVLALAATGEGRDAADQAVAQLEAHVSDYVGDGAPTQYAGATAKLLLVADVAGANPTSFGGRDLRSELLGLQVTSGADAGRFVDQPDPHYPPPTDYSNALSQALAVLALVRGGVTGTSITTADAYLALQQCPNGGVRLSEAGSACTDNATADPDVTGLALQAFVAAGDTAAANKAAAWLVTIQRGDGSFTGAGTTATPNANSTGVIAAGLVAHGDAAAFARAQAYLSSVQLGCAAKPVDRGAVTYDPAARDTAIGGGLTSQTAGQTRRATTQAVLGLAGASYATVDGTTAKPDAPVVSCTTPLVALAYQGVLSRQPDTSGINHWRALLSAGTSPLAMITNLAGSPEAAREATTVEYHLVLQRDPDPSGLTYWAGFFSATQRADLLAAQLAASPERFAAVGGQNWQWVLKTLYGSILGRTPDAAGFLYWTDLANEAGPAGRAALVPPFLASTEGTAVTVRALDQQVCGTTTPLSAARVAQLSDGLRTSSLNPLLTRTAIVFGGC